MKKRRWIVLALCAATLLSCVSCAGGGDPEASDAESNSIGEHETEPEAWIQDKVPDLNFNKDTYTVLNHNAKDSAPAASTGEILPDALLERDLYVENRFNVSIEYNTLNGSSNVIAQVQNTVSSGLDEYQQVCLNMVFGTSGLAMAGYVMNLHELEYFDNEQPWWDEDATKAFQIGETLYMIGGDILPSSILSTQAIIFNKTKMTEQNMAFPYQLAKDGEWTIQNMIEMTQNQTRDLNGDGKIDTDHDFYGFTSWHLDSPHAFFYGTGCSVFSKDENNVPYYDADTQRIEDIYTKVYELFVTNESYYETDVSKSRVPFEVFRDGRSLFLQGALSNAASPDFKTMEDEYGLLPQPKYQATDEYKSFVNGGSAMLCVPTTVQDTAFVGAVLEGLANASYNMVRDELIETLCKSRNAPDPESAEMVDIIINGRTFDFGYIHYFPSSHSAAIMFQSALDKKQSAVGRFLARCNDRNLQSKLTEFLKAYGVEE